MPPTRRFVSKCVRVADAPATADDDARVDRTLVGRADVVRNEMESAEYGDDPTNLQETIMATFACAPICAKKASPPQRGQ